MGLSLCLLLAVFAMGSGKPDRVLRLAICLLAVSVAAIGLDHLVRGAPHTGDGAHVQGTASQWAPGTYLLWVGGSALALETSLLASRVPLAVYEPALAGIVGIGAVLVAVWGAFALGARLWQ